MLMTPPVQQLYPEGLTPFIANPQWQDPSSYAQVIIPQGLVEAPSWNPFSRDSILPMRPGQTECINYLRTGDCTFGAACKFDHPREKMILNPECMLSPMGLPLRPRDGILPMRPGQPECTYYIRTGYCKFGAACKFDHPREKRILNPDRTLSPMGLPLRPGKSQCFFYSRYGLCKFGPNCKFDHPIAVPKSIVTESLSISTSSGAPTNQQQLGSSSGLLASTMSSESSPIASPSKFRHLPSSNS